MRLSKTNRLTEWADSKTEWFSWNLLANKSKSSSESNPCPKWSPMKAPMPDLMVVARAFGSGFGWGMFSIVSILKLPFRFTMASTSSRDAKYSGKLNESTFSWLVFPCHVHQQKSKYKSIRNSIELGLIIYVWLRKPNISTDIYIYIYI